MNTVKFADTGRMGRTELLDELHALRKEVTALRVEKAGRFTLSADGFVIESLAAGWFCRADGCGVWNGDEKVFLRECRVCESSRPSARP